MEDFFYAGGLPALLRNLGDLLDTSAVDGQRPHAAARTSRGAKVFDDDVIRTRDNPLVASGHARRAARQPRPGRSGDQATRRRGAAAQALRTGGGVRELRRHGRPDRRPRSRGGRELGAGAAERRPAGRAGHARVGPAADPEEAARDGGARHGAHLRRAHERHQLRRLRAARRARVARRGPAGARARRRRDRARRGSPPAHARTSATRSWRSAEPTGSRPRRSTAAATARCTCSTSPRPTRAATSTSSRRVRRPPSRRSIVRRRSDRKPWESNEHRPSHRRPSVGAVPGQPVQRTGRVRAAADPGLLRHLRPRQRRGRRRRRCWRRRPPGRPTCRITWPATSRAWCTHRSATPDAQPAAGVGLHGVDRARVGEHADRRRARHHQPDPGAAAGQRHLRHPGGQPGAAGAGAAQRVRHLGQRRVPAAVPVLRPGVATRAAARGDAGRDAGARPTRPRPVR